MIEHKGTVISVTDQEVLVEIPQQSACASCRARTLCSLSEQTEKRIALPLLPGQHWSVGAEVMVSLSTSLGFKAVFLMYVLPLLSLLAVLFTLSYFKVSELVTGLAALTAPLLCYGVVWLFRDRIGKRCVFVLQKV
ncbi:MAG: SoxR reducing system RseC family protein [Bacteroidetes bacterium]|nr:SoxR reducing system RseC family protein [Bacteroidota bacterium]